MIKKLSKMVEGLEQSMAYRKAATKLARQIDLLKCKIANGEINDPDIEDRLAEVQNKYRSGDMSLEDVKREVENIYGDQSDNSTYYFSRQSSQKSSGKREEDWYHFQNSEFDSLEDVEREVDDWYGDQSDNSTWYSDSKNASSKIAMSDHEVLDLFIEKREDGLGGKELLKAVGEEAGMSLDEVRSVVQEGGIKVGGWAQGEEYHLRSQEFDEYSGELGKEGDGYFKQDDFAGHGNRNDLSEYKSPRYDEDAMPSKEEAQGMSNLPKESRFNEREINRIRKDFEQVALENNMDTHHETVDTVLGRMSLPVVKGDGADKQILSMGMDPYQVRSKGHGREMTIHPVPKED